MPPIFTDMRSSRVSKPKSKSLSLKRSTSSPFAGARQRKPITRTPTKPEAKEKEDEDLFEDQLDDVGLVHALATDRSLRDVAQNMKYISAHMFDDIPEKGGMNSVRISEILNFRASLPLIVTVAHVHALIGSPTFTEREIAELTRAGTIRKVIIPARGVGAASVSEGLVLVDDWEKLLQNASLEPLLIKKYLQHLKSNSLRSTISQSSFLVSEITVLMQAGFLTSPSSSSNVTHKLLDSTSSSKGTAMSIYNISKAASGSAAAIGGNDAFYEAGGGGGANLQSGKSRLHSQPENQTQSPCRRDGGEVQFSLPNTGPFLRLLVAARSHLIFLLSQSKYKQMPLYLLREKWDGGIAADDPAAKAKKYRGEFKGILPSRTRKWKQYYGLNFDWVLAECLGAGMIEVFETGSVGHGVRIVS